MNAPIVTVYTNDKNLWLLSGFQYLFRKYWSPSKKARVVGYSPPKNGTLAENFSFFSIDRRNYPASEWSNGVIRSLDEFIKNGEEFIIMMLEDFWITSPVNTAVIDELTEYVHNQTRNILRIDLTADRCQHRSFILDEIKMDTCMLIRTSASSPYQMSYQAGIWNTRLLREILQPYENPWQSEMNGSKRLMMDGEKYIVLGTRNCPLRYQPVYRTNRASLDISKLTPEDQHIVMKRGWI